MQQNHKGKLSNPVEGLDFFKGCLQPQKQARLVELAREIASEAPLFRPAMPRTGKPLSVQMTNCGKLGWLTDQKGGYRYQEMHPETGKPWPPIPDEILDIWASLLPDQPLPEACLINFYETGAKMGMHQDRDEQNLEVPVLSISLGDTCRFRIGGTQRGGKTTSFLLESGDVLIMGGKARLAYHGVDRIYSGTSNLLEKNGRLNMTLRRVSVIP
jgi:alkylated DNA repair protein (DNA oxidative demethylase)